MRAALNLGFNHSAVNEVQAGSGEFIMSFKSVVLFMFAGLPDLALLAGYLTHQGLGATMGVAGDAPAHRANPGKLAGKPMRVPDFMLKCVGFVAEYIESPALSSGSFDAEGTGFFVNIPSRVNPANHYFAFVTAKHVAVGLQNRLTVIVVNQKGGGIAHLDNADNKWYLHPDESVDVAVMAFTPSPNLDIRSLPLEMFLDKGGIEKKQIGIGDEIFMPGLFTYTASETRIEPILRHGNIAMMPEGAIQVDAGFAEVYLVEARSIGGMSGSPVLVRNTMALTNPKGQTLHGVSGEMSLLGLMHGHWDIRESEINAPQFEHDRKRGVNLGIAVVVPAAKILEVINHPGLVQMREEADLRLKQAISPAPDGTLE